MNAAPASLNGVDERISLLPYILGHMLLVVRAVLDPSVWSQFFPARNISHDRLTGFLSAGMDFLIRDVPGTIDCVYTRVVFLCRTTLRPL